MAEWDIETITLRAARDYADQLHFARGAGDDAAAYEEDLGRAKAEIAAALVEHDREVRDAALTAARDAWFGGMEQGDDGMWHVNDERIDEAMRALWDALNPREPDDAVPGSA